MGDWDRERKCCRHGPCDRADRYPRQVNLVGHVAVAASWAPHGSSSYLAGSMLPDLAAMARVRLGPAGGEMGAGISLHHAADAAFHGSDWFNERNQALRDSLLAGGVDRGAARACAHAGLEMLLDGGLVTDAAVRDASDRTFAALVEPGPARDAAHALVGVGDRAVWRERLSRIGTSIDVGAYRSPDAIAARLFRMTRGRRRIELPAAQVDAVAGALASVQGDVVRDASSVVHDVVAALRQVNPSYARTAGGSLPAHGVVRRDS
jgi:hypothetical protein